MPANKMNLAISNAVVRLNVQHMLSFLRTWVPLALKRPLCDCPISTRGRPHAGNFSAISGDGCTPQNYTGRRDVASAFVHLACGIWLRPASGVAYNSDHRSAVTNPCRPSMHRCQPHAGAGPYAGVPTFYSRARSLRSDHISRSAPQRESLNHKISLGARLYIGPQTNESPRAPDPRTRYLEPADWKKPLDCPKIACPEAQSDAR